MRRAATDRGAPRPNLRCIQPSTFRGFIRAHRDRRCRHRRPGNRLAPAPAGPRRHAVRGGQDSSAATRTRSTSPWTAGASGRHRLPRLQRPHVSEAASRCSPSSAWPAGERDVVLVRVDDAGLEWSGTHLAALFAQRATPCDPRSGACSPTSRASTARRPRSVGGGDARSVSLGEFLGPNATAPTFATGTCCRWRRPSGRRPAARMFDFPLATFLRFCHNHGLLQVFDRPQWRTVAGGGREYVRRSSPRNSTMCAGDARARSSARRDGRRPPCTRATEAASVRPGRARLPQRPGAAPAGRPERAGARACSAPSATSPTAPCCTPTAALLPRARRAWSAWNYLADGRRRGARPVGVSYLINRLQPLPFQTPVVVTLNPPSRAGAAPRARASSSTRTPCSTRAAVAAQRGCRRCRASAAPGSPARAAATASTRTACVVGGRGRQADATGVVPARRRAAPGRCRTPPEPRAAARPRRAIRALLSSARHAPRVAARRSTRFVYRVFCLRLRCPTSTRSRRAGLRGCTRAACSASMRATTVPRRELAGRVDPRAAGARGPARATARSGCTRSRVLGYVFNPVSFFYCHDRDGAAARRDRRGEQHLRRASPLPARARRRAAARDRADADRDKVFHVSPFCAVAGATRFRSISAGRGSRRIDYVEPDARARCSRPPFAAGEPLTDARSCCAPSRATPGSRSASSCASTGRRAAVAEARAVLHASPLRRPTPETAR